MTISFTESVIFLPLMGAVVCSSRVRDAARSAARSALRADFLCRFRSGLFDSHPARCNLRNEPPGSRPAVSYSSASMASAFR